MGRFRNTSSCDAALICFIFSNPLHLDFLPRSPHARHPGPRVVHRGIRNPRHLIFYNYSPISGRCKSYPPPAGQRFSIHALPAQTILEETEKVCTLQRMQTFSVSQRAIQPRAFACVFSGPGGSKTSRSQSPSGGSGRLRCPVSRYWAAACR